MDHVMDFAERMGDRPDLFPWVCLGIVIVVVIAHHKRILAYFDARIDAHREKIKSDAVMEELVRMVRTALDNTNTALENNSAALENNSAAFNNNTAMLSLQQKEKRDMLALLESHEQLSMERIAHVQTVINRVDQNVAENNRNIELLMDRTSKRKDD